MDVPTPPLRRGLTLTQRLAMSLSAGAFFVALVLGFLSASRADRLAADAAAEADLELAAALAERSAPLLERGDLMRLSVLATVARDQIEGRVLVLDRGGRVVIDTALVYGDRQLGLLAGSGPFQRTVQREGSLGEAALPHRESLVPVRFGGEVIGELRVQREVAASARTFDFTWFGLVLLCCLSLVIVAAVMGHHWSSRVRRATDSLIRLSAGESGDVVTGQGDVELQDLGYALQEMERGINDGLMLVTDGFVGMAQQIVNILERNRLVPPGHGARTERLALRLADRVQMLEADREDLAHACRLVDLGKGWVRPAILRKTGELTAEESTSLRAHPLRASDALAAFPPLRRVAAIVRHQSERYDGSGLPDGLRGDRIPLATRILAIAAAFDLLTTCAAERPLEWRHALLELERARGEVFDPWLLDLFREEIEKEPPVDTDRPVMIVPGGTVPWGSPAPGLEGDDEDEDEAFVGELEVLADEDEEQQ